MAATVSAWPVPATAKATAQAAAVATGLIGSGLPNGGTGRKALQLLLGGLLGAVELQLLAIRAKHAPERAGRWWRESKTFELSHQLNPVVVVNSV